MSRIELVALALVSAIIFTGFPALAATTEELTRQPDVTHVSVSPDGRYLAMVRSDASRDTLIIFERPLSEDSVTSGVTSAERERFSIVNWISNDHLVVEPTTTLIGRRRPTGAMFALGVSGERTRLLGRSDKATVLESALVAILPDQPDSILIAAHGVCEPQVCTEEELRERRLVTVNVRTGRRDPVAESAPIAGYFVSDPNGRTVYTAGPTEEGTVEVYRIAEGGVWERLEAFSLPGVGQVPYFVSMSGITYGLTNNVGTADLARVDFRAGTSDALLRNEGSDVNGRIATYGNHALLAVRTDPGFPQWHYLMEHPFVETHKRLRAAFPDGDVELTSITRDGSTAVVRIFGPRNAGDFYLVDIEAGSYSLLAKGQPWIDSATLPVAEPVEIVARDGFVLRGALTQPVGSGTHPAVLLLNAWPNMSSKGVEYVAVAQAMASNGIAVLAITHRGSAGFGRQYRIPERDPDGQIIQRDIADGASWLVERGVADPNRVCVLGEGYGAYAAIKALTVSTNLFECGLALSAHLQPEDVRKADDQWIPITAQTTLNPPSPLDLADDRRSPVDRISNVRGRILIVDPDGRFETLVTALRERGVGSQLSRTPPSIDQILEFLVAGEGPQNEPFIERLSEPQRTLLRGVLNTVRTEARGFAPQRRVRERQVRRYLESLVDEHDAEVSRFLADEDWPEYERYKRQLVDELIADLNIVFVN